MRKVFIDLEKLKNLNSGLGQYCLHLGKALSQLPESSLNLNFYLPKHFINIFGDSANYRSVSKWDRIFRIKEPFDIWHCTHQESGFLPENKKTKIILTIHDLNFLHTGKGRLKIKHRLSGIQKLINRSAAITTISNYTASEIKEHLHIPDIPVKVIYNGNNSMADLPEKKPSFVKKGKFFFSLGIISPKKNFHSLIPVLEKFNDYSLIIAGINSHEYAREILNNAKNLGLADRVLLPGPVTEEEKIWLYKNCEAFLFPSIAEGFGLPVVEAMSLGKPVFLSNHTSLPEIGGDAAFYFRNFNADEMALTIEKGMKEFESDFTRKARITQQASKFSWGTAAEEYSSLYLSL